MEETFETITDWADETFGPVTLDRSLERAKEEIDEFLEEISRQTFSVDDVLDEAADVIITLARLPGIGYRVDAKMKKNRSRKWRRVGDGTGYHIK